MFFEITTSIDDNIKADSFFEVSDIGVIGDGL